VKPCCRQYTGSSVRIIASNAANSAMAQAIGSRRQKANRSRKVTLHASVLRRPSRISGATSSSRSPPRNRSHRRSRETQHHRPGQLAQGVAAAIQRHQPPAPLLDHQLVDPAFAEDEHHGQDMPIISRSTSHSG
jgi:hypothetical protein